MKDEIKEILKDLKKYANDGGDHKLMEYEIKHIQCYITNLQEENRQTKLLKERYQLEKENYKSRNEKAIEYMKTIYFSLLSNNKNYNNLYIKLLDTEQGNKLLNILEGVGKDE